MTLLLFFSCVTYADSIGFGKIAGIKQYAFSSTQNIKVFFQADATLINETCKESQRVYGVITANNHDAEIIDRMLSLIMTAYVANKKVRLHSEDNSCEIGFVSLQEEYF